MNWRYFFKAGLLPIANFLSLELATIMEAICEIKQPLCVSPLGIKAEILEENVLI